jgi:hypothetical protein
MPRAGSANSFQSAFANAAAPVSKPASPVDAGSGGAAGEQATPPVDKDESAGASLSMSDGGLASLLGAGADLTGSKPAQMSDSVKTNDSLPTPGGRANLAAAGTPPANTKVGKKVNQPGDAHHAEASIGAPLSGALLSTGASPAAPQAAVRNQAPAQAATADRTAAVKIDGRSADSTENAAVQPTAPAGGLSGAAFALHVTQTGNPSDRLSITGTPQPAAQLEIQPGAGAAAASPAYATAPNSAVLAVGAADSTAPPAGGTALTANNGGARSRQVSALGSSFASLGTAPWSGPSATPPLNDQPKSAASAAAAPVAEIDAEDSSATAQPVRMLQLQLGGTGNQRVDLRLVEHAGGLSVGVRAADSELTRGLQDNLPELSARLAAEHYQTETWLPATSQPPAAPSTSGSSEHQSEQRGGQSSQGGSSFSGGEGKRQQERRQDQPPAWWRASAAAPGASVSSSTSVQGSTSVQSSPPTSAASPVKKQ